MQLARALVFVLTRKGFDTTQFLMRFRHKKLLAFSLLSLSLGVLNYFLFQPRIVLFNLFLIGNRKPIFIHNTLARHFFTGYFSDIAWCCALYWIAVILAELSVLNLPKKVIILLLPFAVETAQYFHLIQGTFDWYDMLTYLVVLTLFLIIYPSLRPVKYETK